MENDKLNNIIDQVTSQSTLSSEDIPSLDLYMDQIMTLFDEHLSDNKRHDDDKLLTKTMINNYSKAKVITPVKGKKYTKEQIIQMLIVYQLKNTITIQEIKTLLQPVYLDDHYSIQEIYDKFFSLKDKHQRQISQLIKTELKKYDLDINSPRDKLIFIMLLSSLSNQLTHITEQMIDQLDNQEENKK